MTVLINGKEQTADLLEKILISNQKTDRQNRWLIRLTVAILVLTAISVVFLIVR